MKTLKLNQSQETKTLEGVQSTLEKLNSIDSEREEKNIGTHDGPSHADEAFAIAAFELAFPQYKFNVIRTREEKKDLEDLFAVIDISRKYDPGKRLFDHHQWGKNDQSKPLRENGIPYSSFGLVWKEYGERICGSQKVADAIDEKLVQSIDLRDCDGEHFERRGVQPFTINDLMKLYFGPVDEKKDGYDYDTPFFKRILPFTREMLSRLILHEVKNRLFQIKSNEILEKEYLTTEDKRIFILPPNGLAWQDFASQQEELLYVIFPYQKKGWGAEAVRKNPKSTERRKPFPESWSGKSGDDLVKECEIPGALFCQSGLHFLTGETKEDVIQMIQKALNST